MHQADSGDRTGSLACQVGDAALKEPALQTLNEGLRVGVTDNQGSPALQLVTGLHDVVGLIEDLDAFEQVQPLILIKSVPSCEVG